jgi:hypothetical protein
MSSRSAKLPMLAIAFLSKANLGQQVPNWYGSFGVSVLGSQRVGFTSVVAPWASFLNYGPGARAMQTRRTLPTPPTCARPGRNERQSPFSTLKHTIAPSG